MRDPNAPTNVEDCYMRVMDWLFDPWLIDGEYRVKVIYVHDMRFFSWHRFEDLAMLETTMTDDLIREYTPILTRNQSVLAEGLDWNRSEHDSEEF